MKNIIIFGAGSGGSRAAQNLSADVRVHAFCDNDKLKAGTFLNGIPIILPNSLTDLSYDEIIIASEHYEIICKQLEQIGVPSNLITISPIVMQAAGSSDTPARKESNIPPHLQPRKISETCKVRASLSRFCIGDGLDVGFGGDPIVPNAICMDLPKKYAHYEGHPQHLHGSADNLNWFKDNSLDWVYSSHVFEDFENTQQVLFESLRIIRPGGFLILFLPDEQAYRSYCKSQGKPPNHNHVHEYFSLSYVKDQLKKCDNLKYVHEVFPSNIYSFELVIQKLR